MGLIDFMRRVSSATRRNSAADASADAVPMTVPTETTASMVQQPPASEPLPPSNQALEIPPEKPTLVLNNATATTSATTSSLGSMTNVEDDPEPEDLGSIHNYDVVKELGRGATAVVQLGRKQGTEELVALKVFKTSLLKKMREFKRVGRRMVVSTALDKVQKEIAIMKKLDHPNLLHLIEVMDNDDDTLVLALEYAPHGQIMEWDAEARVYKANPDLVNAEDSNLPMFSEEQLRDCMRQLLLGLEYLHDNDICHRDLKPENILVGDNGMYKIADFGVAHLFEEEGTADNQAPEPKKKGYVTTTAGTYAFMGPETLKGGEFDAYGADIWALGITLYALVFGTIPYYHTEVMDLFEMIENQPLNLDDNNREISSGLRALLEGMLEKDPARRWSIEQCKEHAWVLEGLDEASQATFLSKSKRVSVSDEEIEQAVTRVASFRALVRVHIGANKWMNKTRAARQRREQEAALAASPVNANASSNQTETSTIATSNQTETSTIETSNQTEAVKLDTSIPVVPSIPVEAGNQVEATAAVAV